MVKSLLNDQICVNDKEKTNLQDFGHLNWFICTGLFIDLFMLFVIVTWLCFYYLSTLMQLVWLVKYALVPSAGTSANSHMYINEREY